MNDQQTETPKSFTEAIIQCFDTRGRMLTLGPIEQYVKGLEDERDKANFRAEYYLKLVEAVREEEAAHRQSVQDNAVAYADQCIELEGEIATLRQALSQIATNLGSGAFVSENASLEFITKDLPKEVKLVCDGQRAEIARLKQAGEKLATNSNHAADCTARDCGHEYCDCGCREALAAWEKLK